MKSFFSGLKGFLFQAVLVIGFFVIVALVLRGCQGVTLFDSHDSEREAYYSQMNQEERHWAEEDVRTKIDEIENRQGEIETALDDLYYELGESDEKFEASAVRETMWEEYQELEEDRKALEQELEEIKNASK